MSTHERKRNETTVEYAREKKRNIQIHIYSSKHEDDIQCIYSLTFDGPPRTRPVRRAAIRPTFLPGGESRATVVA